MQPFVTKVDLKRKKPNWTLYIGRAWAGLEASKWHNPFHKWMYGRKHCIELYENYIRENDILMAAIPELSDQILGCWCYPEACHGDVLVKVYKEVCKPEVGDMAQAVDMHGNLVLAEPKMIVEDAEGWVRFEDQLGYWPKDQVVWP